MIERGGDGWRNREKEIYEWIENEEGWREGERRGKSEKSGRKKRIKEGKGSFIRIENEC